MSLEEYLKAYPSSKRLIRILRARETEHKVRITNVSLDFKSRIISVTFKRRRKTEVMDFLTYDMPITIRKRADYAIRRLTRVDVERFYIN